MILNYNSFIETLIDAGFSMGGSNDEGIYAIIPWNWKEEPPYETPVRWYCDIPDIDPAHWIDRILNERKDIAYGKLFFKKTGYITEKWYPYFFAVRRGSMSFDEAYEDGKISHFAKRIYDIVAGHDAVPLHTIKQSGGFTKEDKSGFDRALTELQMKMFISACGKQQKLSQKGEEYGWSSNVFCLTERFFEKDMFEQAAAISIEEAKEKITEQVLKLNPAAQQKKIDKFIYG